MKPGDKVRLKANPGKIGILGNETDGQPHRQRLLVQFLDGDEQFILEASLEKVERELNGEGAKEETQISLDLLAGIGMPAYERIRFSITCSATRPA